MFLASAGLSIEPKGQLQGQSPFLCSVGEVVGVPCGSVALWEAQVTLCDYRPSLVPGREGEVDKFGAIAKSPIDQNSDFAGEGD